MVFPSVVRATTTPAAASRRPPSRTLAAPVDIPTTAATNPTKINAPLGVKTALGPAPGSLDPSATTVAVLDEDACSRRRSERHDGFGKVAHGDVP